MLSDLNYIDRVINGKTIRYKPQTLEQLNVFDESSGIVEYLLD